MRHAFLHPYVASHSLSEEVDPLYREFLVLFKALSRTFPIFYGGGDLTVSIPGRGSAEFNQFFDSFERWLGRLVSADHCQAYELFTKFRAIFSCIEDPEVLEALKSNFDNQRVLSLIEVDFKKAYCSDQSTFHFMAGSRDLGAGGFVVDRRKRGFSDEVECELYESQIKFVSAKLAGEMPVVLKRILGSDITLMAYFFANGSQSSLVIHSIVRGVLGFNSELDRRLDLIHQQVMGNVRLGPLDKRVLTEEWPCLAFAHVDPVVVFEPRVS